MVASSSQPSGSGHAPIESERTSAATFPGVQENHRLAGNRPSSNNQPVSQFLLSYAFFTYHLLHHAPDFPLHRLFLSPSRELNSQAVLLLPGLPSSFLSVFTDAAWIFQIQGKEEETVGGTVATLILHLEKVVVGGRWGKGGLQEVWPDQFS